MRKVGIVLMFAVLIMFAGNISATIINVPADQPNIQAGIDASSHGDTVRVASGTYVENIDFSGKNIVVGSWFLDAGDTSFISSTIIDGNQSGSVVSFLNDEDNTAVITGFTIQNGLAQNGGGILCYFANPTIINNTIIGNSADYFSGGIYCYGSNPTITNNTISGNTASNGGGICCYYFSNPTISNNTISENTAVAAGGGISCMHHSNPMIGNNTISGNSAGNIGGGIYCVLANPTISNNTIRGNTTGSDGGGICCYQASPTISNNRISGNTATSGGGIYCYNVSNPTIINNTISRNTAISYGGGICCDGAYPDIFNTIVWDNNAANGNEIYVESGSPVFSYCDIQGGWEGDGNIDSDPIFRDSNNNDFHLMSIECGDPFDSPCIDAGDPSICDLVLNCDRGLGGFRSDMGAYGGDILCSDIPTLSEWGMIILALLLLTAGTIAVIRRRRAVTV